MRLEYRLMAARSQISNLKSHILIAGGGPGGAGAAIRLAQAGFPVTLVERERFPREKLCGEFISPECLEHFRSLGVLDEMLSAGGEAVSETKFFEPGGRSIAVPAKWFGHGGAALSLSRAEMDRRLLDRARAVGVEVREESSVSGVEIEDGRVQVLRVRGTDGNVSELCADIFIDATGRARVLSKLAERAAGVDSPSRKPEIVCFKTHVRGANIPQGRCELYSFPDGYGGLTRIENGLANHCFMVKAAAARDLKGDADAIVSRLVFQNARAAETLRGAAPEGGWLAVAIDRFGITNLSAAENLFAIGDAAAFIDPFTGSGMLMALESGGILADCIIAADGDAENTRSKYIERYRKHFARRLRICSLLRHAAFSPKLAGMLILSLGASRRSLELLASSTRPRKTARSGQVRN